MTPDRPSRSYDQKMTQAWTERRQFERYIRPEVPSLRHAYRLLGGGHFLIPSDPPVVPSGLPRPSSLKWLDLD